MSFFNRRKPAAAGSSALSIIEQARNDMVQKRDYHMSRINKLDGIALRIANELAEHNRAYKALNNALYVLDDEQPEAIGVEGYQVAQPGERSERARAYVGVDGVRFSQPGYDALDPDAKLVDWGIPHAPISSREENGVTVPVLPTDPDELAEIEAAFSGLDFTPDPVAEMDGLTDDTPTADKIQEAQEAAIAQARAAALNLPPHTPQPAAPGTQPAMPKRITRRPDRSKGER